MKKLLFTLFLSFVLCLTFNSISFSATEEEMLQEIEEKFTSGLFSKDECIKFKTLILGEDTEVRCGDNKTKLLTSKASLVVTDPMNVLNHVKALGTFSKPSRYPEGMYEIFGKACNLFVCQAKKATQKMIQIFERGPNYIERHPGAQLYGMAMFELMYQDKLRKDQKKIEKFIINWPNKRKNTRTVISSLKLNKARKKMREALGMDLETSIEEAMETFWIMGDFLEQGKAKKQNVNDDIKKRRVLLTKYKETVTELNNVIKNKKDEEFYKTIKKKK